jgi:hypothetical protein
MEYERVRALQEYEDREVHARDKLQRCALDIRTQISEREQQRSVFPFTRACVRWCVRAFVKPFLTACAQAA